jgi:hypothetical protein
MRSILLSFVVLSGCITVPYSHKNPCEDKIGTPVEVQELSGKKQKSTVCDCEVINDDTVRIYPCPIPEQTQDI